MFDSSSCLPYLKAILYHALDILKTDELLYPVVFTFSELLDPLETWWILAWGNKMALYRETSTIVFRGTQCVHSVPLVSLRSALILTCMNIRACPFSHGSMSVILWAFLNCKWSILQKRRNHTMWWLLFSNVCNVVSEKRGVVGYTGCSESLHQGLLSYHASLSLYGSSDFCKYKYVNST